MICIISNNYIYGLVQAARQYYKMAVDILKNSGLIGGNVDPCFNIKKIAKGIVYIALYVDDNFMAGDIEATDDAISAFKNNGLVCKVIETQQEYWSCEIKFSEDKKRV